MKYNIEIKYGSLMALLLFLVQWVLELTGYSKDGGSMDSVVSILTLVVPAGCIAAAMIEKRRKVMDDRMTYWQAVVIGMITTVMSIPLQALFTYLLLTFVAPDLLDKAIAKGLEMGGNEEALHSVYTVPSYIFQTIVGGLAMGVMLSALLAIMTKKK